MKTRRALHIAEHIWEDTMHEGSTFMDMMKNGQKIGEMKPTEAAETVSAFREEVIARWANVIIEADGHVKDDDQTKV